MTINDRKKFRPDLDVREVTGSGLYRPLEKRLVFVGIQGVFLILRMVLAVKVLNLIFHPFNYPV